jgi:excisionase family DNA binding protein
MPVFIEPILFMESLLRPQDVARILAIKLSTAYLLMQRGDIPSVRIGRVVRVRPGDLEWFIGQHTKKGDTK